MADTPTEAGTRVVGDAAPLLGAQTEDGSQFEARACARAAATVSRLETRARSTMMADINDFELNLIACTAQETARGA